jgi:anti-sigma regulatory factor (Ser/Thr protein kinase)
MSTARQTVVRYTGTFPAQPGQVARVRREVGEYLAHCPARDDVVAVVSELAANAVIHSLSGFLALPVMVRVERHGTWVLAEVEDAGGTWRPNPEWWEAAVAGRCSHGGHGWDGETCSDDDGRPHGLHMVALLARMWGVTPLPAGRVVWARVEI